MSTRSGIGLSPQLERLAVDMAMLCSDPGDVPHALDLLNASYTTPAAAASQPFAEYRPRRHEPPFGFGELPGERCRLPGRPHAGGDQGRQLVLGRRRIQDQRLIQAFGPGTIRRQQGQQGPLALQRRRPLADCQGRQQALQGQQGQIACWGRLRLIAGFAAEEHGPVEQQQQAAGVNPGTIQGWRGRWLFSRGGGQGIDSGVLG